MTRLYRTLRWYMLDADVDTEWLARKLGMSRQSLSLRFNNKVAWRLDEMYKILDILNLPYTELGNCFPKDGISRN